MAAAAYLNLSFKSCFFSYLKAWSKYYGAAAVTFLAEIQSSIG